MTLSKSKTLLVSLLASLFFLSVTVGCGGKKDEKKENPAPEKPKMDTGQQRPIVPAN